VGGQRQGANAKLAGNGGRGGRENTKFLHLYPMPSDGDPVVSVGVFKIYTRSLVSIGYGADTITTKLQQNSFFLIKIAAEFNCAGATSAFPRFLQN